MYLVLLTALISFAVQPPIEKKKRCSKCSVSKNISAFSNGGSVCSVCYEKQRKQQTDKRRHDEQRRQNEKRRQENPRKNEETERQEERRNQSQTMTADEMNDLGDNYYYGNNGKSQDYVEAAKWYRKAAEQGHKEAIKELEKLK